jgi:hypothetical protein
MIRCASKDSSEQPSSSSTFQIFVSELNGAFGNSRPGTDYFDDDGGGIGVGNGGAEGLQSS